MKIGILTFHQALNYGAILQEYALQHKLEQLGYRCEIINYINKKFETEYHSEIKHITLKKYIKRIVTLKEFWLKRKRKKLNFFVTTNIKLSDQIYEKTSRNMLLSQYNIIITGSDQVFNLSLTDQDWTYFLDFVQKDKSMAYAPSFGVLDIPITWDRDKICSCLNEIKYLSAREKSGAEIIRNYINRNVPTVVDPTLLLEKDDWMEFVRDRKHRKNYLLLYTFETGLICDFAEKIARESHLQIVKINAGFMDIFNRKIIVSNDSGIEEFLSLIYYSEIIITNSYHGMLFSFIFDKPFYVFPFVKDNSVNSRMIDFLNEYHLENHLITSDYEKITFDNDYTNSKKLLTFNKKKSIEYIEESLKGYKVKNGQ